MLNLVGAVFMYQGKHINSILPNRMRGKTYRCFPFSRSCWEYLYNLKSIPDGINTH